MRPADRVLAKINDLLREMDEYEVRAAHDLGRLWRDYLHQWKWRLLVSQVLTALWCAHPFFCAFTWRFLVDDVLRVGKDPAGGDPDHQAHLALLFFAMNMGFWTLWLVSHYGRALIIQAISRQLVLKLRRCLHEKLQRLHIGFYERNPTGRIMSRVLDDVNVINHWVSGEGAMLIAHILKLSIGLVAAFLIDWRLALFAVVAMPGYAVCYWRLQPSVRRAHIAMRRLNSRMYALAGERVGAVELVKAFCRELRESLSFGRMTHDQVRIGARLVLYEQGLAFLAGTITSLTTAGLVWYGTSRLQDGSLTVGTIMAFLSILSAVFEPVQQITSRLTMMQGFLVVLRRVFLLLDEPEDVAPGRIRLSGMTGKIFFDRVTFTYPNQQRPALEDLTFKIKAGSKVALMGPSGAGKSTVASLLMRFYDPQEGAVRVGGVNLVDADPASVRRHVCMVQQEPIIFSGTVADAIAYGRLDATPEQVMEAAQQAEIHDFIMTLPVKYESEIGERGITLSGGQKQRLALATALLTRPEVLLLDDTTSALDARTEARIRATLNAVLKGRTSLIITQRVATARDCDSILVLEEGRLVAQGTHDELIARDGFYRRVCVQQGVIPAAEATAQH